MSKFDSFFKVYSDSEEQLDFKMAHETVGAKVSVIRTGSYVLDDALSCGGLPKGRLIQFYGPPASGKSLLAMIAIKNAQQDDPDANQMWIDAENTFSTTWAKQLGLDLTKILLVDGDMAVNGRKCFEMLLGVPKEDAKHVLKGKSKDGFLDKIASKDFNVNLIVLDSLGAIIPPGEDVSAVGKSNMALLSRFLTPTFRKLSLEVTKAKVPFIIINHKRDSFDMYGPDHTFAGGNSYAHFLSANIYFEPINRADLKIVDKNDNKIGHGIRATVEKSKFGPHPRKCEFKVNFGIGIVDQHEEVAQLAVDYEVITKPSSVTHEYKDQKWVGFNKFCEAVRDNKELFDNLVNDITSTRDGRFDKAREEQTLIKVKSEEESEKKSKKKKEKQNDAE